FFGINEIQMKSAAGISMIQVLASSLSGLLVHHKNRFVDHRALFLIGIPMAVSSIAGAYFSKYLEDMTVSVIFGIFSSAAFFLFLQKKTNLSRDETVASVLGLNIFLSVLIGIFVGSLSGIVGAGGGFILVPLMTVVLGMPLKTSIGTSLGIILLSALFGAVGKIISLQVEYSAVIPVVIASIPASAAGAHLSRYLPSKLLKFILLAVIAASSAQVWMKVFLKT
ncbi:sulfite exporter TauE/SafE family protein, partial [candidate division WOR-3 bacterium]|nr:sulfite exporter TauE/SafE family protein [candidate division WOR-3 bacterium]